MFHKMVMEYSTETMKTKFLRIKHTNYGLRTIMPYKAPRNLDLAQGQKLRESSMSQTRYSVVFGLQGYFANQYRKKSYMRYPWSLALFNARVEV